MTLHEFYEDFLDEFSDHLGIAVRINGNDAKPVKVEINLHKVEANLHEDVVAVELKLVTGGPTTVEELDNLISLSPLIEGLFEAPIFFSYDGLTISDGEVPGFDIDVMTEEEIYFDCDGGNVAICLRSDELE